MLAPGTYVIRFIGLSAPYPGTTQVWLDRVTLSGEAIDTTAPTITASATQADGSAYESGSWTNQPVTVHYTCSDEPGGSGIAAGGCPDDTVVSDETALAGVDVAESVSDAAGNSATSDVVTVKDRQDRSDGRVHGQHRQLHGQPDDHHRLLGD